MTDDTDEQLFDRWIDAQDSAAFALLYRRYAGRVYGLYRRGGLPEELCEELVQQTFLHVHRARHDFHRGARVRPWLFAIAVNVRREHHRWRFSRPETPTEDLTLHAPAVQPPTTTPSDRLLRRALEGLPDDQREVILLHWFEDLPFDEVARIVGATVAAVKVRAHRGYGKLRGALGLP